MLWNPRQYKCYASLCKLISANMHTLTIALSVLSALSSVSAQAPSIISAYPSATAAAFDNTNKHGAPNGKAFKYFMQIWLENQVSTESFEQSLGLLLMSYE